MDFIRNVQSVGWERQHQTTCGGLVGFALPNPLDAVNVSMDEYDMILSKRD